MAEEKKVKVRNRSNGLTTEFSQAGWAKTQKDPRWANVFEEVKEPEVPAEVQRMEAKKAEKAAQATAEESKTAKDTK